ncbi:alpha-tectorin-like [Antennarius striatus]|uniref:alpha-tectorin-like n=1 Tax=Antennarius striatus TaxID=241820 RepID=UPI0035AF4C09
MVRFGLGNIFYPPGDNVIEEVDDGSSPLIELEHDFFFFLRRYSQIYVNTNGVLTFRNPFTSFTPQELPLNGPRDLILVLWTDIDNRQGGEIRYAQHSSPDILDRATRDIELHFPECEDTALWVFVATWIETPYFARPGTESTFQAVLISGAEFSFVLFNYGTISPREGSFEVGYDTIGSTHFFTIPGPIENLMDTTNVNLPGRWAFKSASCTFNGEMVPFGESFWTDNTCTERCTCTAEGLECQNEPCSFSQVCWTSSFQYSCQTVDRGTCTISGDPHYYTFDGVVFHFQGTCTYVLSEQCKGSLPYYRVEGSNEHRGNTRVAWTRQVTVFVGNYTIELVKGHPYEAKVNGVFQNTPISLSDGIVQVYDSGSTVVVSTYFGLEVSYDTNHLVRIRLPFTYQDSTCGLCGNFNDDPADDFQTPLGDIVISDVDFANSWQTSDDDGSGDDSCEPDCEGLECAGCTEEEETLYSNADYCGILLSNPGPFSDCHAVLPPDGFVESCVFDLCVVEGYQRILCQALNAYASQCQQNGILLPRWRQDLCETSCPPNSHFEPQGTSCPATCVNPNSPQNCPLPPQASCICDPGHVLSAGVCVPLNDCGCSFEGHYYGSGETVILDEDCGRQCSCSRGIMTCRPNACLPLESCDVMEGERRCRPNSFSTCWKNSYGSYHTFDGLKYHYPGACELILVNVTGLSDYPQFLVTTEKVPRGLQGFIHVLKFWIRGIHVSIKITRNIVVHVNGQRIRLPYNSASHQIQIYRSGIHSVILRTSFGVTVQIVWPHFIRITAPDVYGGSLGGLCGDINGNPDDDFRTPDGMLVGNSQDFGDSWRIGSLNPFCVKSANPVSTNTSLTARCDILGSPTGPFAQCFPRGNPQPHIDACVEIVSTNRDPQSALCQVLQDFALMCQQQGFAIEEWRNALGCGKICPLNSHYELCGSSCSSTCPSLSFPLVCATVCQEGCQCDDGLILSGDECVSPPDCGCYYQGRYWQGGEMFWEDDDCQSLCTCDGSTGTVSCVPSSCGPQEFCGLVDGEFGCHPNPHGHCSASGDPHYLTFDGKAYDFQGTCRYLLMALCNATEYPHEFSVEAENEPWLGLSVSITAAVYVTVSGYHVHMTGHTGVVEVNGIIIALPANLNGVSIFKIGSRTFVVSDYGPSVSYDGWSTVAIYVPSNYSERTCGLCGNFNGNPDDDFQTPSGMIVNTPDEFGTSWKVGGSDTCSDGCGSSCPECTDDENAIAQCQVIQDNDGPFSFCHEVVDPAPYFNDCVYDVCVSGNEGQDLLCAAIKAYVSACQSASVRIFPWRHLTPCGLDCPANSHYDLCGTDCGNNCVSPHPACDLPCYEDCFCDEGFARSGTTCVPVENCGCQHEGIYYNAGETFWLDDCSRRCECHSVNDLRCDDASCPPPQECAIRHGHLDCFDPFSTCTVWGDPHYVTFDGNLIDFQGTCSYIIADSVNHRPNEIQFGVTATNNHRGNNRVSFVSRVDIHVSSPPDMVHISIGNSRRTTINGNEVSLPTSVGNYVNIERDGSFVVVNASDLIVQFDGRSILLVRVNRNRLNRVIGMCGNLNYDPNDDRVFPNGTLAQNDNDFGNSWISPSSQPGCGSTDEEFDDGLDNCVHLEKYYELCGIITNTSGPFQDCHMHVDPAPFFRSCVYDLCHYSKIHGIQCIAVAGYERTCSVLRLDIPEWRPALGCAETDPCEELDCTDNEWCGERNGVYGCFCDEFHSRDINDTYDSYLSCESSMGNISLSRCQLFEAGFDPSDLHLQDESCTGTVKDGRVIFQFDNDDQLCGTVLRSNSTHFFYENSIHGQADPADVIISRHRRFYLFFSCKYELCDALSMGVGINPIESIIRQRLPSGEGQYEIRMIPFEDPDYQFPLSSNSSISIPIYNRFYVEVRTEGVDERQISTILYNCWATPVDDPDYPTRWDLIIAGCPNSEDGTVQLEKNGVSTVAHFSFRMFTFNDYTEIYLHCKVHLCVLSNNDCPVHCHDFHRRARKEVSYHSTAHLSLGGKSNGTHFIYENIIQADVDPRDDIITHEKSIRLRFSCENPLTQALSMDVGINPVDSIVRKDLPSGQGRYHLRMIPYEDSGFRVPMTRRRNFEQELDERVYIEVQTKGVDERQISTILESCWATPFNDASHPVHWDLIIAE